MIRTAKKPLPSPRRCSWARNALAIAYHDEEWGRPVRDERKLFECLILEGAQAGLSWDTILAKRENYRRALDGFDYRRIARYGAAERRRLLADPGIVRNRAKIASTIANARAFLAVQKEHGSFSRYLRGFEGGKPGAQALSKDLKRRGFNFVGSTIMYAFMQAIGMVDDHEPGCYRYIARGSRARLRSLRRRARRV
ncbi:MAG TPA: DNA-3-methyladenine glycosylase I [Burkholderiales bacterium]